MLVKIIANATLKNSSPESIVSMFQTHDSHECRTRDCTCTCVRKFTVTVKQMNRMSRSTGHAVFVCKKGGMVECLLS